LTRGGERRIIPGMDTGEAAEHARHMRRCLMLARRAQRQGDAPVGSLVVRDGKIIGQGIEAVKKRRDIAAHAEIEAIREAVRALGTADLSGCILYTSVEPCFMCSYAIRQTGIAQVVLGRKIAAVGGASSRYPILRASDIPGWAAPPDIVEFPQPEE
jgi:tRNA(adenine34) deaminase